jgi:hypothetical protein
MLGPADSAFHGDQRSNRAGCYFSFLFRGVTAHSVRVLVPVPTSLDVIGDLLADRRQREQFGFNEMIVGLRRGLSPNHGLN